MKRVLLVSMLCSVALGCSETAPVSPSTSELAENVVVSMAADGSFAGASVAVLVRVDGAIQEASVVIRDASGRVVAEAVMGAPDADGRARISLTLSDDARPPGTLTADVRYVDGDGTTCTFSHTLTIGR